MASGWLDGEILPVTVPGRHKGEVVPVPILCSVTFGAPIALEPGEERRPFLDRARRAVMALREV
mgnify:CR=1 FL=1